MSPQAGCLLIYRTDRPRLRITSRCLPQVGADDADELYQDGIAIAARMLDSAERNGKKVTAATSRITLANSWPAAAAAPTADGRMQSVRRRSWMATHD